MEYPSWAHWMGSVKPSNRHLTFAMVSRYIGGRYHVLVAWYVLKDDLELCPCESDRFNTGNMREANAVQRTFGSIVPRNIPRDNECIMYSVQLIYIGDLLVGRLRGTFN